MNKYLNKLLYGKREDKVIVDTALGIPDTLHALDVEAALKPHIAFVSGVLYFWSVDSQEWVAYALVANEVISLETADSVEYTLPDGHMIDMIVLKSPNADLIDIFSTPPGVSLTPIGIQLQANVYKSQAMQIIADGSDKVIDFTGFTGSSIIKIYKRKLTN